MDNNNNYEYYSENNNNYVSYDNNNYNSDSNPCGIISFIFAMVSILLSICGCCTIVVPVLAMIIGIIALALEVSGIILGIVGATKKNAPKGLAIAGLVINIIMIVVLVLTVLLSILGAIGMVTLPMMDAYYQSMP